MQTPSTQRLLLLPWVSRSSSLLPQTKLPPYLAVIFEAAADGRPAHSHQQEKLVDYPVVVPVARIPDPAASAQALPLASPAVLAGVQLASPGHYAYFRTVAAHRQPDRRSLSLSSLH
jgi:hypothetical protein